MFSLGDAKTKNQHLKNKVSKYAKFHFHGFLCFTILYHKLNTQGSTIGFILETSLGNDAFLQVNLVLIPSNKKNLISAQTECSDARC